MELNELNIRQIAGIIRSDWKKPYFAAVPYLLAMTQLEKPTDLYVVEDGKGIINYFLCNASTWKGPIAREVKKELIKRVR